jgi:FeS assembly protein IscX
MPKQLTWEDVDDIGIVLSETHPQLDPLSIHLPDLRRYVSQLPQFHDDPNKSSEAKLKAIQLAWHNEFLDRTQG